MACDQTTRELLSTYVDGEATPQEAERARTHLDTCAECREMVQEWRRGLEMLDWTYAHALPDGAEEPTFQPPAPPERSRGWSFSLPNLRGLAVAAVLALITLTGLYVYQQVTYLPTLGRSLSTAQKVRTVLVAKGIRLEIMPDTQVSRLGERAIRLVQGTIKAEVTHGTGFTVHTRKLEIIDQGTEFEVHSDPTTDRVTVIEGSVLVREGKDVYPVGEGETLTSTGDELHNKTRVRQTEGDNMNPNMQLSPMPVLIIGILGIICLVLWVRMLVDALTREFRDSGTKIAWVLAILLGQMLGALIYYAVVYAKGRPNRPLQLEPSGRGRHLPPFAVVARSGSDRVVIWQAVALTMAAHVMGCGLLGLLFGFLYGAIAERVLAWTALGAFCGLGYILRDVRRPLDELPGLDDGVSPHLDTRKADLSIAILWSMIALLILVIVAAIASVLVDNRMARILAFGGFPVVMLLIYILYLRSRR